MNWIEDLCKQFGIKVKLINLKNAGGTANVFSREIILNKKFIKINNPDKYTLHIVCHEICHILGFDNNKYINYYTKAYQSAPLNNVKHIRKIALKAERYTDKMARKMVKSAYPDMVYYSIYPKKWFYDNWLNKYFPINKRESK